MKMQIFKNKKGFINALVPMAMAIIIFTVVIVIGVTVTQNLTTAVGCDKILGVNGEATTYNASIQKCVNATATAWGTHWSPNTAGATGYYLQTKMGEGSGGLASWTPAVIALMIGVMFIGAFAGGWGRKKQY